MNVLGTFPLIKLDPTLAPTTPYHQIFLLPLTCTCCSLLCYTNLPLKPRSHLLHDNFPDYSKTFIHLTSHQIYVVCNTNDVLMRSLLLYMV